MKQEVKTLRLNDMVFNRRGSFLRRLIHALVSLALRLFFRRIETVNASEVPYKNGLIFVMNHPNGLIDPALVFVALPRKVSFLAKSTLFKTPVISWVLRLVEALPVYRKIDSADVSKNMKTFEASHELLQKGGAIALFPEGVSHNSPKLLPIKTGAARIALGAISLTPKDTPVKLQIVPVGLYYTNKTSFRSEALLHFGKPFNVNPTKLDEDGNLLRSSVNELNDKIEDSLKELTLNAESETEIDTANAAANLFLSVTETVDIEETIYAKFDFVKDYLADQNDEQSEMSAKEITSLVSSYKKRLRKIGLEPENLSLSSQPFWYVFQHFFVKIGLLIIFLPFSIFGTILHFPAYQVIKFLGKRYTNHGVDDIISTVKIIAGIVFMPLMWIVFAGVLFYFVRWETALISIPISFFCGFAALKLLEEIYDLRGWFKAIWLFYRKRDLFFGLLKERRELHLKLKNYKELSNK